MEYRVGIVGCGGIARVHAQSLLRMDNVKMIAFADCKPERAQGFASEYGGNAYASLEKMLAAEHLDVLHICTPHALHVPMALQAAEKGIQVFTEKPAAVNDEQMDALMEAAKKVHVGVCFQNRYNDNVRYVQQALQKGEGGKVLGARVCDMAPGGALLYGERLERDNGPGGRQCSDQPVDSYAGSFDCSARRSPDGRSNDGQSSSEGRNRDGGYAGGLDPV